MNIEMITIVVSFIMGTIAFSYAFFQKSDVYVLAEGFYIGGVAINAFFQIVRSFKAIAWDHILAGQVLLIIPVIIGLLAFARLTKYRWLSRYPTAILAGISIGALFGLTIRGQFIGPIQAVISMITSPSGSFADPISRTLIIFFFFPVLLIFLFSKTYSATIYESNWGKYIVRLGRIGLVIYLGYQSRGVGGGAQFLQTVIKKFTDLFIQF